MINSQEIEYLKELMDDFPPSKKYPAAIALRILLSRHEKLEKNNLDFIKTLKDPPSSLLKYSFEKLISEGEHFPSLFYQFSIQFHKYLFTGILGNAGEFRRASDPNQGKVGFGGADKSKLGSPKFFGATPDEIRSELLDAFSFLRSDAKEPIKNGLSFYRKFVKVHPFYDANGRIGRLILSIYLQYFGYHINWTELESGGNKTKFIKRLNECHLRETQRNYDKYFNYLLEFFKRFTVKI
ncbi:MAG: Fic family protein [Chlorobi bacterium]|nr:Fic family protein [Chlorobiota bacterium]